MARGLARNGWDIDNRDGSLREKALDYVLRFCTYELKDQTRTFPLTHNFFIEYEQKGRPSGIAITEAECFVNEFLPDCYVLIPTRRFKRLCDELRAQRGLVRGGDYNQYRGILVKWDDLLKIGY